MPRKVRSSRPPRVTSSATSSARSTPTSSCATSTRAPSSASTSSRRWRRPRTRIVPGAREPARSLRRGAAVRRRGHLRAAEPRLSEPRRPPEATSTGRSGGTSTSAKSRRPAAQPLARRRPQVDQAPLPASASRRSAEPRPSRATGDHATSGTDRAERPEHHLDGGEDDDPVLPGAETRHHPLPTRSSRRPPGRPRDLEGDLGADRGHQPAGQADRGTPPGSGRRARPRAPRRRAPRPAPRGRRAARTASSQATPPRVPHGDPGLGTTGCNAR